MIGARRWVSIGPTIIATASAALPIWRGSCGRSPRGTRGAPRQRRSSRAFVPTRGRRQPPIAGDPADVVQIAADYSQWMAENDIAKLFVNAEPGAILIGVPRDFCRSWKNQTEVTVPGSHFIQEDSGPLIGRAVADWMKANAL